MPPATRGLEGLEDGCRRIVMVTSGVTEVPAAGTRDWQSTCGGLASFLPVVEPNYTDNLGVT